MRVHFQASQSLNLSVAEQPVSIRHYLRQPQRLVKALVDPSRTEQLRRDCFRLKMRPLHFMSLSIQPTVDMRVWAAENGTLHLQSVACEIRGVDYINQRFHLELVGQLIPSDQGDRTQLNGEANLKVGVDLPPPLWFTPTPILEATGNGLLQSVLMTIKQRLMHHLLSDYYQWVEDHQVPAKDQPLLALPDSPMA